MNRWTINRLFVNCNLYHYAGIGQRSDSELRANNSIKYVEPDGRYIIYLNDQDAVLGDGHVAMLIGNEKDCWTYYSKDGKSESPDTEHTASGNFIPKAYKSLEEFFSDKSVSGRYNRKIHIETSQTEDNNMKAYADANWDDKYNFAIENCSDLVVDTMMASGNIKLQLTLLLGNTDEFFPLTSPNRVYDTLNAKYGASFTSRLGSRFKNRLGVLPMMVLDRFSK